MSLSYSLHQWILRCMKIYVIDWPLVADVTGFKGLDSLCVATWFYAWASGEGTFAHHWILHLYYKNNLLLLLHCDFQYEKGTLLHPNEKICERPWFCDDIESNIEYFVTRYHGSLFIY